MIVCNGPQIYKRQYHRDAPADKQYTERVFYLLSPQSVYLGIVCRALPAAVPAVIVIVAVVVVLTIRFIESAYVNL